MRSDGMDKIVFLIIISGRKQKDNILSALLEQGVKLINSMYGKGTVKASYLQNVLGLVAEENKAVITCALPGKKTDAVLNMLIEKFSFDKPNTGIAFTMPIDRVSF